MEENEYQEQRQPAAYSLPQPPPGGYNYNEPPPPSRYLEKAGRCAKRLAVADIVVSFGVQNLH